MMIEVIINGVISGLITSIIIVYALKNTFVHENNENENTFLDSIINARIEFVETQMLLYNKDTNEFITQANNWDEMNDSISEKYPNKIFKIELDELEKAKKFNKEIL